MRALAAPPASNPFPLEVDIDAHVADIYLFLVPAPTVDPLNGPRDMHYGGVCCWRSSPDTP